MTVSEAQSQLGSSAGDLDDATFSASDESILEENIGTFSTDSQYIDGLDAVSGSDKTYIAAVTPWFFTHYSPETYDKNVRLHSRCYAPLLTFSVLVDLPRRLLVVQCTMGGLDLEPGPG